VAEQFELSSVQTADRSANICQTAYLASSWIVYVLVMTRNVARKILYRLNRPTEFDSKGSHQIMGGCGQGNCAADWIVGPKKLTERFLSATWIFCRDVLIVSIIARI
jgi:hypothetical protein